MSVVKITQPGYLHGGTKLELDGQEIQGVTGLQLNFPVDGIAECHVGILVEHDSNGEFRFEAPMDCHLHFHCPEGSQVLDVTPHAGNPGTKLLVIQAREEGK